MDEIWEIESGDMIPMLRVPLLWCCRGVIRLVWNLIQGAFLYGPTKRAWKAIREARIGSRALLPIGFTRTLVPAYTLDEHAKQVVLPLYGYTLWLSRRQALRGCFSN